MSTISRRDLLRGLSVGGAAVSTGCGRLGGSDGVRPDDTIATVSVTNVRRFAPGVGLSASVEAVRPWVTPDRTALIELSFRNDWVTPVEVRVNGGKAPFLWNRASVGPPPKISLPTAPDAASPLSSAGEKSESGCWRLRGPVTFPQSALVTSRIPPTDRVSVALQVWGHHENDGCLPTGTFRFEDQYQLPTVAGTPSFEWRFTLRIAGVDSDATRN